jgi:hypothetical protein
MDYSPQWTGMSKAQILPDPNLCQVEHPTQEVLAWRIPEPLVPAQTNPEGLTDKTREGGNPRMGRQSRFRIFLHPQITPEPETGRSEGYSEQPGCTKRYKAWSDIHTTCQIPSL